MYKRLDTNNPRCNYNSKPDTGYITMMYCILWSIELVVDVHPFFSTLPQREYIQVCTIILSNETVISRLDVSWCNNLLCSISSLFLWDLGIVIVDPTPPHLNFSYAKASSLVMPIAESMSSNPNLCRSFSLTISFPSKWRQARHHTSIFI